jgi:hypothetical protein
MCRHEVTRHSLSSWYSIHTHTHTHIYIYIHTYIHTNMHTYIRLRRTQATLSAGMWSEWLLNVGTQISMAASRLFHNSTPVSASRPGVVSTDRVSFFASRQNGVLVPGRVMDKQDWVQQDWVQQDWVQVSLILEMVSCLSCHTAAMHKALAGGLAGFCTRVAVAGMLLSFEYVGFMHMDVCMDVALCVCICV